MYQFQIAESGCYLEYFEGCYLFGQTYSSGVKIIMFEEGISEVTGQRCLVVSIIDPSVVEDCVVEWQLRSLQFCTITNCPACSVGSPQRRAVCLKVQGLENFSPSTTEEKKGFISVPKFSFCKRQ